MLSFIILCLAYGSGKKDIIDNIIAVPLKVSGGVPFSHMVVIGYFIIIVVQILSIAADKYEVPIMVRRSLCVSNNQIVIIDSFC